MVNVKGRLRSKDKKANRRKSGFVYKPRAVEDVKRRAERTGGRFDSPFKPGFDVWRPKQGDNLLRILPPTWEDFNHFGYTIWVHGYVGPDNSTYLCRYKMLNKKCPICDASKEARESGDLDEAKQLQATEKVVCWILDREENEETPQIFMMSWSMDRDITSLSYNKRTGKVLLIDHDEEGYDLTLKRSGQGLNTRYFGLVFDRDPTPILDDEKAQAEVLDFITENPIPSVLQYHSVEHLENVLAGGGKEEEDEDLEDEEEVDAEEDEVDEDEDEEETGKRRKAARTRQEGREARLAKRREKEEDEEEPDDEEEDDQTEDEEEQDEEEEERKPRGRRAKAAEADEEEDEDEDADEEKNGDEDGEDEDEDEEGEARVPARRARTTNGRRVAAKSREDEEEDEDDEDERPSRRPMRRPMKSKVKSRRVSAR